MFDFENQLLRAPEEVKKKISAVSAAYKRYQLAREQNELWFQERDLASKVYAQAQSDWAECLTRWNPETNEFQEKVLFPPTET